MAQEVAIQDDGREAEMRTLFELLKPEGSGRAGTDAILKLDSQEYQFELKSTTTGSVTTVRDFGYDHIRKWKNKHWLIGIYDKSGKTLLYSLYGSPQKMRPWIDEKEKYIRTDFKLSEIMPSKVAIEDLYAVVGKKEVYTLDDAKRLHKKQYTQEQYKQAMDLDNGFSPKRMTKILSDRCGYLIARGSTLNNPHIPKSYFNGWVKITENHSHVLRELVRAAIIEELSQRR